MSHKVEHDLWVEGINKGRIKMPPLPDVWRDTTPPLRFEQPTEGLLERRRKRKAEEYKGLLNPDPEKLGPSLGHVPIIDFIPGGTALKGISIGILGVSKRLGVPWKFAKKDADFYILKKGKNAGRIEKEAGPNTVGVVVDKEVLDPSYAKYMFGHIDNTGAFKKYQKGTAIPYITNDDIDDAVIEAMQKMFGGAN